MKSARSNSDVENNTPAKMGLFMANAIKKCNNSDRKKSAIAVKTIKSLIKLHHGNPAYLNAVNDDGVSVLSWAISTYRLDIIKDLVSIPGIIIDLNALDSEAKKLTQDEQEQKLQVLTYLIDNTTIDVNTLNKKNRTALHWAVSGNCGGIVAFLLSKDGVNITAVDAEGSTPLSIACQSGYTAMVTEFLQHSGDTLKPYDAAVIGALSKAASYQHSDIVKLFIKAGLTNGVDLLSWAVEKKYADIVDLLLQSPTFNPYVILPCGDNYVTWAMKNKHEQLLQKIMKLPAFEKNAKTHHERTLVTAANINRFDLVHHLKHNFGTDINAHDEDGDTALHFAALKGDSSVMSELLRFSGVKVNTRNNSGNTALHVAALHEKMFILNELLTHADLEVNARNAEGCTALHVALNNSNHIVFDLLYKITDINLADASGKTLLIAAIIKQDLAVIKKLVADRRCELKSGDALGKTALMYAAELGLIDVINMLLARDNSMVNLFDAEGKTALHHAAKNHDNVAIIKTLLASGADISIANYAGQTALALATAAGHECVLSLLQTKGVTYLKSPEIKATASPSAPPLDDLQDLPDSSADQQLAVSRKDINRAAFFQRPDANPLTPPPAANDHSGYQY